MNKPANVVLLADDEAKIRRFLRAGFELKGYEVLEAERGAEALKIATFRPPDLIILDLILPDLPGVEVLEKIRSWSNAPIIVLTVVSDEQQKVRLLRAGADDYVVKPFSMVMGDNSPDDPSFPQTPQKGIASCQSADRPFGQRGFPR